MAISQKVKDLIESACGEEGPNISAKGSMIFFDDDHLAYWERSKRKALENLGSNKRVVVVYSNMQAQREGRMESPVLRFYGTAEIHESGPMKDTIFFPSSSSASRSTTARTRGSAC